MLVSWDWLARFVDLSGQSLEALSALLTSRGVEVEGIEQSRWPQHGVVVARVVEVGPHPDAAKLRVVQVDVGEGALTQVVCGAPNVAAGLTVLYAGPGAVLPSGQEVRQVAIRGVASSGMLCSESELGLGQDSSGLLCLEASWRAGTTLAEVLAGPGAEHVPGFHLAHLDLSLTPNRGDALSHLGVARELAAALQRPLQGMGAVAGETWDTSVLGAETPPLVEVACSEGCPRYIALCLEDVVVGPSPGWLRRAVEAGGGRSVNNVVDVTNLVLFELGQPQHAFDLDKLRSRQVMVRRAQVGESLVAIDHATYALDAEDLVIADVSGPVAIAGVMGGAATEVSSATRAILLEVACFSPRFVRRTAKRLGLHSESSHRFERGVDVGALRRAASRTVALIQACQPTRPLRVSGWTDSYPGQVPAVVLPLRLARCNAMLGTSLSAGEVADYLGGLGLVVEVEREGLLRVQVPTYRYDLEREIDLIEEVARSHGLERIEATMPACMLAAPARRRETTLPGRPAVEATLVSHAHMARWHRLRALMVDRGFFECVHYAFIDPSDGEALGYAPEVGNGPGLRLANPLAHEQSVLRVSLLPGLLRALLRNQSRQARRVMLFELGTVFAAEGDGGRDVRESERMAVLLWGDGPAHWGASGRSLDVYDLKGVVEGLGQVMGWPLRWDALPEPTPGSALALHPGVRVGVYVDEVCVGSLGELHPGVSEHYKVGDGVFVADLDLAWLMAREVVLPRCAPLPRFPHSSRDLALVLRSDVPYARLREVVEAKRPAELVSWALFDVYRGEHVAEDEQSLAMSFCYRDPLSGTGEGRTLTDEEVNQVHETLVEELVKVLGGRRR